MSDSTPQWYDDEAGPLVRLYAMTAGRARSKSIDEAFDLMATIQAVPAARDEPTLSPEQLTLLRICRRQPQTVTDIASESNLPLGVVRVLLGDLLDAGLIYVTRPVQPTQLPDTHILREVIDGLRAL
ncbi:DUF742 domain-containing protein [Actinobacteria bacterium YIM 96077]|uniref:DUF742 domain-containing protein n=1 Tax=Phytoactinopolyspora halophila TaxID=1981511 RepID=A0A329QI42_9ACTN|nr:DUF742 domain-containing protein [Phytoactinopolyspora halophila]AYY14688.1 DUF742 domain-containing protein [Actinobacteria bacterium YIM 96077]RAW11601.1 DUF742 domain-containing protein [Phytoactinopolyspora halophila]